MNRSGEFPASVRLRVLSRAECCECGCRADKDDPWHVHHRIFLASEAARQVPLALLTSLSNAELMHRGCHFHYHNLFDEPPQKTINEVIDSYNREIEDQLRQPRQLAMNLSYAGTRRRIG